MLVRSAFCYVYAVRCACLLLVSGADSILLGGQPLEELTIKLLVVGDLGVGKTSLIQRFSDGEFRETYVSTVRHRPLAALELTATPV